MSSIWQTVVSLLLLLTGCAVLPTPQTGRIVLFAPFEGQHRAVGYNALYAARLALADSGTRTVDLLAVDDGGTLQAALRHARAIATDPLVRAVLLVGQHATTPEVQNTLGHPALIVGAWGHVPANAQTFVLSSALLAEADDSDAYALAVLPYLADAPTLPTFRSSGQPAAPIFAQRYRESAPHTPAPNHLAMLTYDAMRLLLVSIEQGQPLSTLTYSGMSGTLRFRDGYWQDAPINRLTP